MFHLAMLSTGPASNMLVSSLALIFNQWFGNFNALGG